MKGKRGSVSTYSLLGGLFAAAPALFILTNTPSGGGSSPLGSILGGGGSWQSIQNAGWTLAQNVMQNWVTLLILVAIVYVVVKVIRKAGRGVHITKHIRL
jgi:uncharacterized membrane protein